MRCARCYSLFVLQLKATVVKSSDGRPHLVFVASKLIEVGEELLFDYNDRESRLPFLKSCPVCNMTCTGRPAPTTTSHKRPATTTCDDDEQLVTLLAKKTKLETDDADRLYEAVVAHFNTTADITRAALETWLPQLTEDNIVYILHRRNVDAICAVRLLALFHGYTNNPAYRSLCANMMYSTKPEVRSVSQRCQKRTETHNIDLKMAKMRRVVSEICLRTDRPTRS